MDKNKCALFLLKDTNVLINRKALYSALDQACKLSLHF